MRGHSPIDALRGLRAGGRYVILVAFVFIMFAARVVAEVSVEDIEESLTCQCGCGLTVHRCNHVNCPSALPLRQEIREQVALGKKKEEILAYFEAKYGEKILSAPVLRGFNILAWITPFLALAVGAALVGRTVHRWVARQRDQAQVGSSKERVPLLDQRATERLRVELERFEQ